MLPPSVERLRLDAETLNAFLLEAFPGTTRDTMAQVIEVTPGRVLSVQRMSERNLRPGGVISGPTQMGLADANAYALILAHIGIVPMAVTTSLTFHFLRPARFGDLYAEGTLLRLGRRIATCDIVLWTEERSRACGKATVAYALPDDVT